MFKTVIWCEWCDDVIQRASFIIIGFIFKSDKKALNGTDKVKISQREPTPLSCKSATDIIYQFMAVKVELQFHRKR